MNREEPEVLVDTAEAAPDSNEATTKLVDPLIGTRILDNYKIVSVIASGGMGTVYRAKHLYLQDAEFAVKVLRDPAASEETFLRFKREAEVLQSLNHPNIVGFKEFGCTKEGTAFLIIDLVEGESLSQMIKREGKLTVEHTIDIFTQIGAALAYAHKNNLLHRDVKPSNIMLVKDAGGKEVAKLLDFGIAKALSNDASKQLTRTGETFGSPLYMSPEQCLAQKLDARSDVYAVGCVIYECIQGRPPLEGETVYDTIYKQMNELPPGLAAISDKRLRESVETVVFRAIAKKPDDRYATMDALNADLELLRKQHTLSLKGLLISRWRLSLLKLSPEKRNLFVTRILVLWATIAIVFSAGIIWLFWYYFQLGGSSIEKQKIIPLRHYMDTAVSGSSNRSDEEMANAVLAITMMRRNLAQLASETSGQGLRDRKKVLLKLGQYYKEHQEYAEASGYFQKLYDLIKTYPDSIAATNDRSLGFCGIYLADSFYYMNNYKKAEPIYEETISIVDKFASGRSITKAELYFKLADCQLEQEKFEQAHKNFDEAIACWQDESRKHVAESRNSGNDGYGLALIKDAEALRHLHRFAEADVLLEQAQKVWAELRGEQFCEYGAATGLRGLVAADQATYAQQNHQSDQDTGALNRKAEEFLRQGEKIIENSADPDHHLLMFILANHTLMLEHELRYLEALPMRLRFGGIKPKDKRLRDHLNSSVSN